MDKGSGSAGDRAGACRPGRWLGLRVRVREADSQGGGRSPSQSAASPSGLQAGRRDSGGAFFFWGGGVQMGVGRFCFQRLRKPPLRREVGLVREGKDSFLVTAVRGVASRA